VNRTARKLNKRKIGWNGILTYPSELAKGQIHKCLFQETERGAVILQSHGLGGGERISHVGKLNTRVLGETHSRKYIKGQKRR